MLIHGNVDDEGTLEEEEMLEELEDEGSSGELNDLQKVNCVLQCIHVLVLTIHSNRTLSNSVYTVGNLLGLVLIIFKAHYYTSSYIMESMSTVF